MYGKQITSALVGVWIDALSGHKPETLKPLFRRAFAACKFFPTPADVLEPIKQAQEAGVPVAANLKWNEVLEYCRLYVRPDLPIPSDARKITERTMTAIRAAGGLAWIESCSTDDLVWAKKAFVESYTAWETLKRNEYLLPDGPVKKLLSDAAKALPEVRQ